MQPFILVWDESAAYTNLGSVYHLTASNDINVEEQRYSLKVRYWICKNKAIEILARDDVLRVISGWLELAGLLCVL